MDLWIIFIAKKIDLRVYGTQSPILGRLMAFSLSSALSLAIAKMSKLKQSLTLVLVAYDV